MIYIRFNPEKKHDEKCGFVEGYDGQMPVVCGKPAVGRRGHFENNKAFLCAEHFEYGLSIDGVRESQVIQEARR